MRPAGLAAFELRTDEKTGVYRSRERLSCRRSSNGGCARTGGVAVLRFAATVVPAYRHPPRDEREARGDARAPADAADRGFARDVRSSSFDVRTPCIVTCSISGAVANREQCPAIPYTPEEYAAEAKRAVDEGASMIHIHARTPDGVPSYEVEDFRAITEAIQGAVDDVIDQLLDRRHRHPDPEADRVPARAEAGRGRAQHGLDELREVLLEAEGLRLQDGLRELVRHDHRVRDRDERARHPARARVLRLRPRGEPRPADRHGPPVRAAPGVVCHGRDRRHPPDGEEPRAHVRAAARRRAAATGA